VPPPRPPEGSLTFAFIGAGDRCAAALLTASLAGCFFLLRTGAYLVVSSHVADYRNTFLGVQSVIITVAAMALLALAAARRSTELRSVGILVTLIGAGKVFFYDLVAVQGWPRSRASSRSGCCGGGLRRPRPLAAAGTAHERGTAAAALLALVCVASAALPGAAGAAFRNVEVGQAPPALSLKDLDRVAWEAPRTGARVRR
jgi:hypothetical protein